MIRSSRAIRSRRITEQGHWVDELKATDPTEVGGYRLLGRLGEGGMGTVFLADALDGSRVAVKVIRPELASDPTFRVRLAREAAAAETVSGRFTARVLAADANAHPAYIVSEYIDGQTLAEYVGEHGPLTGSALHSLAAGLAEALTAVHAAGVIHRDLKPTNVIMTIGGPRVLDFGVAASLDETALTAAGTRIGSPGWMAPERFSGAPDHPAGDIFDWGLLVAYAASGRHPFGTGPAEALAYRVVYEAPELPALPGLLGQLVPRALEKEPSRRPTAHALLADLVGARPDLPTSADTPTIDRSYVTAVLGTAVAGTGTTTHSTEWDRRPTRRRAGGAVAAAVLALAVVIAVVGWVALRPRDSLSPTVNTNPALAGTTNSSTRPPAPKTTQPHTTVSASTSTSATPATSVPSQSPDATPTAATTTPTANAGGLYTNGRFGFQVQVPDGFTAAAPPENGSGLAFTSPDGRAVMTVYGSNNVRGDTAHSVTNVTSADLTNAGGHVTYENARGQISAVSGTRVVNGVTMVVYQRTVVGAGSEDAVEWTYPVSDKGRFDPLLEASVASFRSGDVSTTW